mmetsp:Transcript_6530/g.6788  ORF Transcript_6530/g.6788 Transcript_6530/m.6788 type:complete len:120 (-) Transcript_6530:30-389(-)
MSLSFYVLVSKKAPTNNSNSDINNMDDFNRDDTLEHLKVSIEKKLNSNAFFDNDKYSFQPKGNIQVSIPSIGNITVESSYYFYIKLLDFCEWLLLREKRTTFDNQSVISNPFKDFFQID